MWLGHAVGDSHDWPRVSGRYSRDFTSRNRKNASLRRGSIPVPVQSPRPHRTFAGQEKLLRSRVIGTQRAGNFGRRHEVARDTSRACPGNNRRNSPEPKGEAVRQIADRGYAVAELSERPGVSMLSGNETNGKSATAVSQQNGSPNPDKSLVGTSRNPPGMHPVSSLPPR